MFDINDICIIGGDERQAYLGALLAKDGKTVTYFALEKCGEAQPDYASLRFAVKGCDAADEGRQDALRAALRHRDTAR